MHYLKNLQTQLSQNLWISKPHREPNKHGDSYDKTCSISIISRPDISYTAKRFSISATTQHSSEPFERDSSNGEATSNAFPTTSFLPNLPDSREYVCSAKFNHNDDISPVKALSFSHNNVNNNSNWNKDDCCRDNQVCNSTCRQDRQHCELIDFRCHQHSTRTHNSSFTPSSAVSSQPVILSLTPLSKSIQREFNIDSLNNRRRSSYITSFFLSPTHARIIVRSPSAVESPKRNYPQKGKDSDECLRDFNNSKEIESNHDKINKGQNNILSHAAINSQQLHQLDHVKKSSFLQAGDREVEVAESESVLTCKVALKIGDSVGESSISCKDVISDEAKPHCEKSDRKIENSTSNFSTFSYVQGKYNTSLCNTQIDDAGQNPATPKRHRCITGSNNSSNCSSTTAINDANKVFVLTSETSLIPSTSSSEQNQSQFATTVQFDQDESRVLNYKEKVAFLDEAHPIENNIAFGTTNRTITTPTTKNNRQVRRSSIACSSSAYNTCSSSSSLFWGIDEYSASWGKGESKSFNENDFSRQVQSCRERERKNEYGILLADRKSISCFEETGKSLQGEDIRVSKQDTLIPEKFALPNLLPTLSGTSSQSSSSSYSFADARKSYSSQRAEEFAGSTEASSASRPGTSPDQSSSSCSSRITTFTGDRPFSCTNTGTSTSNTVFSSPISFVPDLEHSYPKIHTTAPFLETLDIVDSLEPNSGFGYSAAPVVTYPFSESDSSSNSSVNTILSQHSTNDIVLPFVNSEHYNNQEDPIIVSDYTIKGINCSQRVYQKKKSISYTTTTSQPASNQLKKQYSLIQNLLCTNGFNLLNNPKKILSSIFRPRHNRQNNERKSSLLFLSWTALFPLSCLYHNTRNKPENRRLSKRARRRRALQKIAREVTSRGPTKAEIRLWIKMDHEDLIRELPQIEKLSNQERLRLAHKRRMLQLKKFQQYEKDLNSNSKKHRGDDLVRRNLPGKHVNNYGGRKGSRRIRFRNSIMLLEAAGRNDVEEVRLLLESGVNPDVANEDGLTALHQCCIDDNEEMMKILLDYGANVNAEDSERWTPLHAASTCGHLHLVQYLIARGANLLAVNAEGNMPYDICDDETTLDYIESEMAKRGVTQELIEEIRALPETKMLQEIQRTHAQGGDLEFRDADGATPLHIASANGYYRVAEFLLDNHAATDVQDKDFWQPIHAAACWGHLDVLELLVQNGADLDARTKNNETPYAICEDPEIKERIIQLRTEQQTKRQNEGRKRPSRTHSTNSRTQSIRRTSQRDKGLTSKRDAADEAQMLRAREEMHKENSPSPIGDLSGANKHASTNVTVNPTVMNGNAINGHHLKDEDAYKNPPNGNASSEEDPEEKTVIPPHILGRDSVSNMKMKQDEINRLREIAVKSGAMTQNNLHNNHQYNNTNNASNNGGVKMNNLYSNNLLNSNGGSAVGVLSSPDDNGNLLPKPEINPSVDNKVPLGGGLGLAGGMPLSGSRDNLVGLSSSAGNSTIDIHVSVTINTNSPVSTLTNGGGLHTPSNTTPGLTNGSLCHHSKGGPHSIPLTSGNSIFTPPGTLSDLKKQRSLIRTSSNPLTNGTLTTNLIALPILPPASATTIAPSYNPPSFETFKPNSSASSVASASQSTATTVCQINPCMNDDAVCDALVPLSPSLLLAQNNQKNANHPYTDCSQSSTSSWHYYWNDWRNGYAYSQSQFDSSAFSSSTPLPSTNESQSQQQSEHGSIKKAPGSVVSPVVGGVPVLPTSVNSTPVLPLGSYYFNSSVGNIGGGSNNTSSQQYTSIASSCNSLSTTNINNNPFSNNQHCCYLNNLTGGMNDSMAKYHPPGSPTMSLRRFVGDPSEAVGDYGDGGKRCCVIV